MSDYLSRLAGRSLGQELVLQPRLASRYEPVHNQPYQPFLPHFEWASSAVKAGDIESRIEMTESGPTLVPNEHLPSKDNQDRMNDHSDSSTREESSALHELRSNRPSLKYSRALFNQRSPFRLKRQSNNNKAIDEGALQQQQQPQQMHKLESNGHDRSATKKSSPAVPLETPANPKGHARDRLADSTISDLSSSKHIHKVDSGKANEKAMVDRKKEISQAISPQIKDRNALADQTNLIDRSNPLKDDLKRIINSDSAKAELETISSKSQSPEVRKVVGLSKENEENQILKECRTSNKSQTRILGINGVKTSSLPIVKGSTESDVPWKGGLPGLSDRESNPFSSSTSFSYQHADELALKKTHMSRDQGLFSPGTIRAKETPGKERDSRQLSHHDIFLESGMTLSLNRFWPASPYLRALGKKEYSGAKATAPGEEIAGRPIPSEPQIQITIGRVEVRAALQHTPSPKRSNTDPSSLEEYLRKRSGGMRG